MTLIAPENITTNNDDFVALFAADCAIAITNSINATIEAAFAADGYAALAIETINNRMATIMAKMDNIRFYTRNTSIFASSIAVGPAASILTPILKVLYFYIAMCIKSIIIRKHPEQVMPAWC